MIGDNKYVVVNSIHLHAKLHKRHTSLSSHIIQDTIVYNMVPFYHISGGYNQADILSNHCSNSNIWVLVHPLIFCVSDTMELLYF